MALSQAAAPEGVWLAARGWCVQGRPSVTNWMPPTLLCADWLSSWTQGFEKSGCHTAFLMRLVSHPFYQHSFTISINKRHRNTPVINEALWPECHVLSILPQVQQIWPLGHGFSSLCAYVMHPPSAVGVCARKKEENLSLKGFFPMYLKTFLLF